MNKARAEQIALAMLGFIAREEELAAGLLGASGADASDLRVRAQDPDFLGFVFDHLMGDDLAAQAFAEEHGLGAEDLRKARAQLPGAAPEW